MVSAAVGLSRLLRVDRGLHRHLTVRTRRRRHCARNRPRRQLPTRLIAWHAGRRTRSLRLAQTSDEGPARPHRPCDRRMRRTPVHRCFGTARPLPCRRRVTSMVPAGVPRRSRQPRIQLLTDRPPRLQPRVVTLASSRSAMPCDRTAMAVLGRPPVGQVVLQPVVGSIHGRAHTGRSA